MMTRVQRQRASQHSKPFALSDALYPSLLLNAFVLLGLLHQSMKVSKSNSASSTALRQRNEVRWNGADNGHHSGSCWCSNMDKYCMCTPSLAIDLVITTTPRHDLWLVQRQDTSQLATMGGFVQVGESVEDAVRRELMEEMNIRIPVGHNMRLLGVYTDPRRDVRRHTASAVFWVHLDGNEQPRTADDVKAVQRVAISDIDKHDFFSDHQTILLDFRTRLQASSVPNADPSQLSHPVARTLCK